METDAEIKAMTQEQFVDLLSYVGRGMMGRLRAEASEGDVIIRTEYVERRGAVIELCRSKKTDTLYTRAFPPF